MFGCASVPLTTWRNKVDEVHLIDPIRFWLELNGNEEVQELDNVSWLDLNKVRRSIKKPIDATLLKKLMLLSIRKVKLNFSCCVVKLPANPPACLFLSFNALYLADCLSVLNALCYWVGWGSHGCHSNPGVPYFNSSWLHPMDARAHLHQSDIYFPACRLTIFFIFAAPFSHGCRAVTRLTFFVSTVPA